VSPEQVGFLVGTVLGALLCVGGCVVALVLVLRAVNRKVEAAERTPSAVPPSGQEMIPLFYVLSVLFWPAAFIVGIHLLKQPHSARAGRNCIAIGLGVITVVTVLTSVALVALAVLFGDRLPI
jgi:hypothetical protein